MYKNTKENGITLVALVITIIVLLILAGVTISYISGGIIDKTKVAIKDYENADNRQQGAIDDIGEYNKEGIDLEKVYDEEGVEDNIAPTELFEYEIINDGSIASSYMQNLPTKTARILGIKPEYCNVMKINSIKNEWDPKLIDTNYEIIYNGNHINDVLVIPYQVEIDSEMYTITEVDLSLHSAIQNYGASYPIVRKVVYPNTIKKMNIRRNIQTGYDSPTQPVNIILSKNLISIPDYAFINCDIRDIKIPDTVTSIGDYAFSECHALTNIDIPDGVTSIGEGAFYSCNSLTNIDIPNSVTSIENEVFSYCRALTNIDIPNSVTSIGEFAFQYNYGLKEIIIPKNIKNIGEYAFYDWSSDQTIYFECSEAESKNWDPNWKRGCAAKIVWNYNPNGATE